MRHSHSVLLAIALTAAVFRWADGQCHYRVTILPTLDCSPIGQDGGTPMALNDYGQVAGKHSHCLADGESAFAWTGGPTIGTIPLPPGVTTARAFDINNVLGSNGIGMVGGEAYTPGPTPYRPFIWFNGQWQFLSYGQNTSPGAVFALNDHGLAVGYTTGANGWTATRWLNGKPNLIQPTYGPRSIAMAVSEAGAVAGWMGPAVGIDSHAFVWLDGQIRDIGVIPGGLNGAAYGINSKGQVIVSGSIPPRTPQESPSRAYLWQDGNWTNLGILQGFNTCSPFAINSRGDVVGTSGLSIVGQPHNEAAWIWRNSLLTDLSTMIVPGSGINPGIGRPRSINEQGQIVAVASVGDGGNVTGVTVLLTPVPDHPGDTDCNGLVNVDDLVNVITRWGPCSHGFCASDLDGNGVVSLNDLVAVILNWNF